MLVAHLKCEVSPGTIQIIETLKPSSKFIIKNILTDQVLFKNEIVTLRKHNDI